MSTNKPDLIAYTTTKNGDKTFYNRIGAAWQHSKGEGLSLKLDAVPLDGSNIVLFPPREKQDS